jgi:GNAT superfamily N-acetyltransferase
MGETGVRIRTFRPDDQQLVRDLVLAGLLDHWGTLDPALNPDLNDIAAWYRPLDGYTVVAEVDNQIAGTGTLHRGDDESGVLARMSVSSDHRGKGIGKALVRALADVARDKGYRRLVCETTDTWQDAINLYLAMGFTIVDRRDGDVFFELPLQGQN